MPFKTFKWKHQVGEAWKSSRWALELTLDTAQP